MIGEDLEDSVELMRVLQNQQIMPEHLLKVMFEKKTEFFYEIIK